MNVKYFILVIAIIFLTLQGFTQGKFISILLPDSDIILGKFLCGAGGFIVQPIADFGWLKLPLPTFDDVYVGAILAGVFAWFAKGIKSKWKFVLGIVIAVVVGVYLYKGLGIGMIYIAEKWYGMSNCATIIEIGGYAVNFSWYDPLLIIMCISALFSIIVLIYKKQKTTGGTS